MGMSLGRRVMRKGKERDGKEKGEEWVYISKG
jgi:hypothetical protein